MKNVLKLAIVLMFGSFLALAVFGFIGLAFSTGFAECAAVVPGTLACPSIPGQAAEQAEIFLSFSRVVLTAVLLFTVLCLTFGVVSLPSLRLKSGFFGRAIINHVRSSVRRQLNWLVLTQRAELAY